MFSASLGYRVSLGVTQVTNSRQQPCVSHNLKVND